MSQLIDIISKPYFYIPVFIIIFIIILIKVFLRLSDELEIRNKVNLLHITFPDITEEEKNAYTIKIKDILDSAWTLLKGHRMSLEIHKIEGKISLIVSTTSKTALADLKNSFTTIPRLTMRILEQDPVENYYNSKIYIRRSVTAFRFYPLGVLVSEPFKNIIDYLSNLDESTNASIMFCLRPVDISHKINNVLRKATFSGTGETTQQYNRYRGEEFLKKLNYGNIFLSEIYTVSNTAGIPNTLGSKLECMRTHFNHFLSYPFSGLNLILKFKLNNLKWIKSRFVARESIFTQYYVKFFGSYLASNELAQLFTPIYSISRSFDSNKSIILEAPEIFTTKKDEFDLLIGTSTSPSGTIRNVYINKEDNRRHKYVAGKTGSGKSTMLISEAINYAKLVDQKQLSFIFFDPHAVDLKKVALRLENWDNVVYFDPSLENTENIITFNPFISGFRASNVEKDSLADDLISLIISIIREKNIELGTTTETLLMFLIKTGIHFTDAYYNYLTIKLKLTHEVSLEMVKNRQLTIPDLSNIIASGTTTPLELMLKTIFAQYNQSEEMLVWRKFDLFKKELSLTPVIIQALRNRLNEFTGDSRRPLFSGNSFNINKLIKENKTILIPITNQSNGSIGKKLLTKMINISLWSSVQKLYDKDEPYRVHMIIDEVQEALNPTLPKILSEARKFGLSVTLANQYLSQLVPNGDKSYLDSILGNVGVINIFQMQNVLDAELISRSFGEVITAKDIVSLKPFNGYIKALRGIEQKIFSIETIDYKNKIKVYHTEDELEELSKACLSKYGISRSLITLKNRKKTEDAIEYFLDPKFDSEFKDTL